MHPQVKLMICLNALGGIAVLGSYAYEFATHPDTGPALWGGVPEALQPIYTISMLLAAVGYFPFTTFLLSQVDPEQARIAGRFGFGWFNVLYALILIPSALWMPLTFVLIERWSPVLWLAIRVVLLLVGVGSLGLLAALANLEPRPAGIFHRLAVAGAVAFCVQTAVLDALVWPAYYPTGSDTRAPQ